MNLFLDQLKKKRFNESFICATTWCFQPECTLHNMAFQFTSTELQHIVLGHQTWRNEIVAGSTVDVMVYQERISCWLLGKVVQVKDDYLNIEFERSPDDYDTVLSRWSAKIAPAGSESASEDEWRRSTFIDKTDVECDSHDGKMWMEATVF